MNEQTKRNLQKAIGQQSKQISGVGGRPLTEAVLLEKYIIQHIGSCDSQLLGEILSSEISYDLEVIYVRYQKALDQKHLPKIDYKAKAQKIIKEFSLTRHSNISSRTYVEDFQLFKAIYCELNNITEEMFDNIENFILHFCAAKFRKDENGNLTVSYVNENLFDEVLTLMEIYKNGTSNL